MILTIIPTYSVANLVLSIFCPFTETKNKNQLQLFSLFCNFTSFLDDVNL